PSQDALRKPTTNENRRTPHTVYRTDPKIEASSSVSTAELVEWKKIVSDSESESSDRQIPIHKLEGYAYVEAVRADVRSDLQAAGYPDAPTRFIEVYSGWLVKK
uniref:hypothetical protein n=1 Tax=Arthrobacter sp. B1805 TaxID=2058892 RepID=UPI001CA5738C